MPVWIEIGGWFRRNENAPDTPATDEQINAFLLANDRDIVSTRDYESVESAAGTVAMFWTDEPIYPQILAVDSETGNELADITPTHDGQVRIVPHQHDAVT